ncbi:MAG: hypothetical protein R3296_04425 [Oleiphilaceae bacterium]|nr:hypothetical protein [Oleiphilaceae bacterium]
MKKPMIILSLALALFSQGLLAHGPEGVEDVPAGLVKASIAQQPDIDGLQILLLEGPRQGILLSYQGTGSLTVLGSEQEPLLRFSHNGVEANETSPTWQKMQGHSSPSETDAGDPRWTPVASSSRYAWMDPRLSAAEAPVSTDKPQTLSQWRMGLNHGGDTQTVSGDLHWHPLPKTDNRHSSGHH